MRILSLTAQKADSTGSGVFLAELVRQFHALGHQQAVVCGVAPGESVNLTEGVQVYSVSYQTDALPFPVCGMSDEMPYLSTRYKDLDEKMTGQLMTAFRDALQRAVEEFAPDVILCHHLYFLAALAREMFPRIPVYGQCHGSDLRQLRKNPWMREWILGNIARLDGIFALQDQQKQTILETFGVSEETVSVMGTGYNSNVFKILKNVPRDCRKKRVVFAGKISEKKGVMSLLRCLSDLEEPEKFSLVLAGGAGNAQEYAAIEALAAQAPCEVSFLGRLGHQELACTMNSGDIFVLPSFYEGLPLVVIEAMACGLRVVCTDLPGIRPWLDQAIPGHGVLFVAPPAMRNEDEPLPESLPAFERNLASALEAALHAPSADQNLVRSLSWESLCRRMCAIWKNK